MVKAESERKNHHDREPENCRVRDSDKTRTRGSCSGMVPSPNPNCARYKISGILAIWPIPDKEFFGYLRLRPSFSVSERTVSMDSYSF
jgi:hypothetical protein